MHTDHNDIHKDILIYLFKIIIIIIIKCCKIDTYMHFAAIENRFPKRTSHQNVNSFENKYSVSFTDFHKITHAQNDLPNRVYTF